MSPKTELSIDRTAVTREKRTYQMRRRAELEEQTRLRIVESTVVLHETLGPSQTSVSAIAEHAGVRRSTVYRHFPDEAALFDACTSHWLLLHPLPDLLSWPPISDGDERLRTALSEIYSYYRRAGQMMTNIHRDEDTMPIVKEMMGRYRQYLADAREVLLEGCRLDGSALRHTRAAIGHALAFPTWRSLAMEQGLEDAECADLMRRLVAASK